VAPRGIAADVDVVGFELDAEDVAAIEALDSVTPASAAWGGAASALR
jgi:hypothetical protein